MSMKHRVLLVSDMHYTTQETHEELKQIDPEAFVSVQSTSEIIGRGFRTR